MSGESRELEHAGEACYAGIPLLVVPPSPLKVFITVGVYRIFIRGEGSLESRELEHAVPETFTSNLTVKK